MKNILVLLLISMFCLGCSGEFLDRGSLTQLSESSFWQTEEDALLGLNGVYETLQDRVLYSGDLNGVTGLPLMDGFSDNTFNRYKYEGAGDYVEGNADPSTGYFNNLWTSLYKGIGRANAALPNIANISEEELSDEDKAAISGQVKFLRALFYFHLAVYYEQAPLILEVQPLEEAYVPKNTYEELAAQVVKDLQEAIPALPNSYPDNQYGYATKGAAQALLARFQLYNKNYQDVVDLTTPLLNAGYSLDPNYARLFTLAGENSNEIVFAVRFFQDAATSNGETFTATFNGIPKVNDQPMPNAVDDFYTTDGLPISESPIYNPQNERQNRDPRLTASVFFRGDIFNTDLNRPFAGNTFTGYGKKKYVRTAVSADGSVGTGGPGSQDFIAIRYADVLLMRAEALVELNQLDGVYPLINQIRARVSMPSIQSVEGSNLSQSELREIVRHERRVELIFEGLRFFDLKRWDTVEEAYVRMVQDNANNYNPLYRGEKSKTFPIPQNELDANFNLTQNPAWE